MVQRTSCSGLLQKAPLFSILLLLFSCTKQPRCEVWEVNQKCLPKTTWGCGYYISGNRTFEKQFCGAALNGIAAGGFNMVTNNTDKIVIWHYTRRTE
jgi:hypothetical protein